MVNSASAIESAIPLAEATIGNFAVAQGCAVGAALGIYLIWQEVKTILC